MKGSVFWVGAIGIWVSFDTFHRTENLGLRHCVVVQAHIINQARQRSVVMAIGDPDITAADRIDAHQPDTADDFLNTVHIHSDIFDRRRAGTLQHGCQVMPLVVGHNGRADGIPAAAFSAKRTHGTIAGIVVYAADPLLGIHTLAPGDPVAIARRFDPGHYGSILRAEYALVTFHLHALATDPAEFQSAAEFAGHPLRIHQKRTVVSMTA